MRTKRCTKCNQVKSLAEFYTTSNSCKECSREYQREYQRKNRHVLKAKNRAYYRTKGKIKAKIWYLANRDRMLEYQTHYRELHKDEKKEYDRIRNQRPEIKLRKRKHRQTQAMKEWHSQYMKDYLQDPENKKRMYQSTCNNIKRKLKTDPKFKLNANIRNYIRYSLKVRGASKNGRKWERLVGYTLDDLVVHIEQLWRPGMTWQNHGRGPDKWQIDHVIPISAFDFTSAEDIGFKQCWALTNLQPLWADENLEKRDKLTRPFQSILRLRHKKMTS